MTWTERVMRGVKRIYWRETRVHRERQDNELIIRCQRALAYLEYRKYGRKCK